MTSVNRVEVLPDFVPDALKEFPVKQQGQENFIKLAEFQASGWKRLDDEVVKLGYLRLLDNSSGVLLDNIGSLLGVSRAEQDDSSFRARIKLRSLRQTMDTSRDNIIELLTIFFQGEVPVMYKGVGGFTELIIPTNCLNSFTLSMDLENIFPISTNLWILKNDATVFHLIDSTTGVQPTGTSGLFDSATGVEDQGILSDWIHSSYRLTI